MRARSTSPWTTSTGCRAACRCCARSRRPSRDVHMEDVHRAGGIMAILGELDRAGLLNRDLPTVHAATLGEALDQLGHHAHQRAESVRDFFMRRARRRADAGRLQPGPRAGTTSTSTARRASSATPSTPSRKDGGLAVLYGNLALDGCIVKTAGVDESDPEILRPGARLREPGRRGQGHPRRTRSRPATSSSSATRGRAAAPACRRCSIRPAI